MRAGAACLNVICSVVGSQGRPGASWCLRVNGFAIGLAPVATPAASAVWRTVHDGCAMSLTNVRTPG